MGDKTKIEWAEATWNPVGGCKPVSAGCQHCYAARMAIRIAGPGKRYEGIVESPGRWNGHVRFHDDIIMQPFRWTRARVIFVCSMGDLFFDGVSDDMLDEIFGTIAICEAHERRDHLFLVLTKRPDRMRHYLSDPGLRMRLAGKVAPRMEDADGFHDAIAYNMKGAFSNLWLGVTTEHQRAFDSRVPSLLKTPAVRRFISVEPLLGAIDMWRVIGDTHHQHPAKPAGVSMCVTRGIDWVIVGGETGPKARPVEEEWVLGIRNQCRVRQVPFLFKKWGPSKDRLIEGKLHEEHPPHIAFGDPPEEPPWVMKVSECSGPDFGTTRTET